MKLDISLDLGSTHSISLYDVGCGRPNTLLDVLLDDDDVNCHLFEASNISLSMHNVSKRSSLREGWQGSCRSFNGSDIDSSDHSFFNVKEKSERQIPSRRTANEGKILSLNNSLLGRLENVIKDVDVLEEASNPVLQYHSPVKRSKTFNTSIKSKQESKRKQRESPKSTSSKQSSDIHRQNKRGMSEESRKSTLDHTDNTQNESSIKNTFIALKRNEKFVSPMKKTTTIEKTKKSPAPSLDDFFASSHEKYKSGMNNYILNTGSQSTSLSSVSCTSFDSEDQLSFVPVDMTPKQYEMMALSNSFPSPKIGNNRKKLSIYNRDMNRSVPSSIFSSKSPSIQIQRSDDSAPKQPRRSHSPPRSHR